ncbi:hypothetical protein IAT38_004726 [Cryptococcus sp. DSM 104549]
MGYTAQLQWTFTPPPGKPVSLPDLICLRILERYGLRVPSKHGLQLRTYRAAFPPSSTPDAPPSEHTTRLLTVINTIPSQNPAGQPKDLLSTAGKDDTGYLFLDDRPGGKAALEGATGSNGENEVKPEAEQGPGGEGSVGKAETKRYQCIAVRPASAVAPMLQSLLSPFVMGVSKAARATASQTSSTPVPTPLPGTSLILTVITFPLPAAPHPPVIFRAFILPNQHAQSIFLEAEYAGPTPDKGGEELGEEDIEREVREFLEGSLIEGLGEKKWIDCAPEVAEGARSSAGWEGVERNKRAVFSLARTLRENGFI